jgi:protein involved in polysaccharide export with SLBB domain
MKNHQKTVLTLCFIFFCNPFQVISMDNDESPAFSSEDEHEKKPNGTLVNASSLTSESYENSLDSLQYLVGSGDVFRVSIVAMPNRQFRAVVHENGSILLPDFGVIRIGKTSLSQAKSLIRNYISQKIKIKSDIFVALIKAKEVTVTVTGGIANPGSIRLSGKMRLFDALKLSNNNALPSISDCDYRAIVISNGDSTKKNDLFQFIFKGSIAENPYVYPGDNIRINLATSRAFIHGALKSSFLGLLPIKENESVADFLSLFPLDASADSNKVIIKSGKDTGPQTVVVCERNKTSMMYLHNNDMIIIPQKENYLQPILVTVSGEVVRQGVYPIMKNGSTVEDVILMAGGITPLGNLGKIVIIRRGKFIRKNQLSSQSVSTYSEINSVRPEINSAIVKVGITNDFCIIPVESVNSRIVLEENDDIVVPKKENFEIGRAHV